ncbi:Tyrosine-protein kinase Src42A [Diplonema papillatum]|nr:Tyrosine-protein kinase Src42A [Diplonema papillatum]
MESASARDQALEQQTNSDASFALAGAAMPEDTRVEADIWGARVMQAALLIVGAAVGGFSRKDGLTATDALNAFRVTFASLSLRALVGIVANEDWVLRRHTYPLAAFQTGATSLFPQQGHVFAGAVAGWALGGILLPKILVPTIVKFPLTNKAVDLLNVRQAEHSQLNSYVRAWSERSPIPIDTTGDGVTDSVVVDSNGDGRFDSVLPIPKAKPSTSGWLGSDVDDSFNGAGGASDAARGHFPPGSEQGFSESCQENPLNLSVGRLNASRSRRIASRTTSMTGSFTGGNSTPPTYPFAARPAPGWAGPSAARPPSITLEGRTPGGGNLSGAGAVLASGSAVIPNGHAFRDPAAAPREIPVEELRVVEPIGAGHASMVYVGLWRGVRVAIKVIEQPICSRCLDAHRLSGLPSSPLASPQPCASCGCTRGDEAIHISSLSEALRLHKVTHPHIVQCFGYAFADSAALTSRSDAGENPASKDPPDPSAASDLISGKLPCPQPLVKPGRKQAGGLTDSSESDRSRSSGDAGALQVLVVMEYCKEGSLEGVLKAAEAAERWLTCRDLLQIAHDVSLAMLSLHADGCIHRDVAARNVFKEDGKYKLGDFGLVRSLEADTDVYQSLSEVPISWTAPEAIRTRSFSKPSDIWSFGVFLWEVLTYCSSVPYGTPMRSTRKRILGGETLVRPSSCPAVLWDGLIAPCFVQPSLRPTFEDIALRVLPSLEGRCPANHRLIPYQYQSLDDDRLYGTPIWAAPEAIRTRSFSKPSDIWSFGVFLWEVLTYCSSVPYGTPMRSTQKRILGGETLVRPSSCPAVLWDGLIAPCFVQPSLRPTFEDIALRVLPSLEGRCPANHRLIPYQYQSLDDDRLYGTPIWAAPEAIRTRSFSKPSDIWSFGVFLWEVLTYCSSVPYGTPMRSTQKRILGGETLVRPSSCPAVLWDGLIAPCFVQPSLRPTFEDIALRVLPSLEGRCPANHPYQYQSLDDDRLYGTPIWAAPEAIRTRSFSKPSDIWSFGVFLWEVLTYCSSVPYGTPMRSTQKRILGGETLVRPSSCPAVLWDGLIAPCFVQPSLRPTFEDIACPANHRLIPYQYLSLDDDRLYGEPP